MPNNILTEEQRRHLIGDDDTPGVLDEYKILVIEPAGSKPMIAWHCPRQHGAVTGHLCLIARDFDGDQTGLTLGELVTAAIDHEIEDH